MKTLNAEGATLVSKVTLMGLDVGVADSVPWIEDEANLLVKSKG